MKRALPFLLITFLLIGGVFARDVNTTSGKSLFELARIYEIGNDTIGADSLMSIRLYKEAADNGYPPAMNYLGFSFYNGRGVNHNIDSALFWIRNAALQGDITAAANLGFLLIDAPDVTHDSVEAEKWLWVAAREGVPGAQFKIVDLKKEEWRELSPDSALLLGSEFYEGKAPVMGVKLLQVAADKGNPRALALMGDAYSKGIGVPYNHSKSIEYFNKAAQAGDPEAQNIINELLEIFPDALK